MHICRRLLNTVLITVLTAVPCFSASSAGESSADFLRFAADPAAVALGGSILARSYCPSDMISNPSALGYNYQPKLSFVNTQYAADVRYGFAGIAVPISFGSFGAGVSNIDYGAIQGYYANGTPYSIPRSGDTAAFLNYAFPIKAELPVYKQYGSAGVNLKVLQSSLAGYSASALAIDIGGTFNIPFVAEGLSAGLVLRNYGDGIKYDNQTDKLPSSVNFALRYDRENWRELFAVIDAGSDPDNMYYSLGIGISPVYPLSLQCAWQEAGKSAAAGARFGVGIKFDNFSLRYALSPMKDISAVHTLAVDVVFESFTKPQAAYGHYLNRYLQMGREKYNKRDYIAARSIFEDILSVYPGHSQSIEYLLKIKTKLDSMEQYQQVQIDRWLRKAEVAFIRNDLIGAKRYYSLTLNIDSNNTEANDGMNKIRDLLSGQEASRSVAPNENTAKIQKTWAAAVGLYNKGDYVAAKEKFQDVLNVDPNNEEAAKYLGDIYNQLNKISAMQTSDLYNKGIELYGKGNYAEAKKYFNAVLITNPESKEAQEYAVECQNKLDELQKQPAAEKAAQKRAKAKNEVEAAYFAALKLYQKGSYEEAAKAFTKSRDIADQNEYKKYEASSRAYITNSKNALSEQNYKRGYEQFKAGKFEEATESYSKALEYNQDNVSAKVELGKVKEQLAQNYYELGMKSYSSGDTDKAKELFKKSLHYKFDKVESLRALERINGVR